MMDAAAVAVFMDVVVPLRRLQTCTMANENNNDEYSLDDILTKYAPRCRRGIVFLTSMLCCSLVTRTDVYVQSDVKAH